MMRGILRKAILGALALSLAGLAPGQPRLNQRAALFLTIPCRHQPNDVTALSSRERSTLQSGPSTARWSRPPT